MHAHERLLREECGYKGAQPYWDETLDAGKFSESIVFSAEEGFGGDGGPRPPLQLTPGCIVTGPFANYTLHIGPGYENTDHCISRAIYDDVSKWSSQEVIDKCLAMETFEEAWPCMEHNEGPHGGGHRGGMICPISW
jgi:tyrosinase